MPSSWLRHTWPSLQPRSCAPPLPAQTPASPGLRGITMFQGPRGPRAQAMLTLSTLPPQLLDTSLVQSLLCSTRDPRQSCRSVQRPRRLPFIMFLT